MAEEPLIQVEHVSKRFCRDLKRSLWYGVKDIAAELFGRSRAVGELRKGEFWAVEDVSFEVRRGECLGLIGPNGAGKSTLLKMLNGLIKPDSGRITMRGRVGALIELGTGFNPILTGRENIYNNAAVLGLDKAFVDRRLDDIIDFAEIGDAIDAPVQSYSSGMKVRLGFAVAAHMEPDVLLIDEVLAVGDAGFRARCYNRVSQIADRCAVIFVSHAMSHVARLAPCSVVLHRGRTHFLGDTPTAINAYYGLFSPEALDRTHLGTGEARIESIMFFDETGKETNGLEYGRPARIVLDVVSNADLEDVVFDLVFQSAAAEAVAECNNYVRNRPLAIPRGENISLELELDSLLLNPGVYRVSTILASSNMVKHIDWVQNATEITVRGGRPATAPLQFLADWRIGDSRRVLRRCG